MSNVVGSQAAKDRRNFLQAGLAGVILSLGPLRGAETVRSTKTVFQKDLPELTMNGWQVTAVEVTIPPGEGSQHHRHPSFVLGYVLEGEMRFQVAGGPETVIPAGQMFYEAPGDVHTVAASASKTKPVRFVALLFGEKGKPLSTPA